MRLLIALCTLALVVGLAAQEPVPMTVQKIVTGPDGTKVTTQTVKITPRCPVSMRLRQGSSAQMLRADDGTIQPLMTPNLTLASWDHRTVIAATVTVHGSAPHARTLPLVAQFPNGVKDPRI